MLIQLAQRQSNWLSYSYTINALVYEWLEVVHKMAVSFITEIFLYFL